MHTSRYREVSNNTFESRATDYVQFLVVVASMQKEEQSEKIRMREEQQDEFAKGTYEYREASKEQNMILDLGDPTYLRWFGHGVECLNY